MNLFTYVRLLLIGIIAGMLTGSIPDFCLLSLALFGLTQIIIDAVQRWIDIEIKGIFG